MFDPDLMERIERTRDRIECTVESWNGTGKHLVKLAMIATGALVIIAASLVWIAVGS